MSTVTPNFNWPVPTSTDLVKDGATAIEALGDSIDASMVDLKGGTTGQVLSKASNTDMDFVWVTNADGDITGVTAGTGLTGGGTSGTVSLAFDQTNYGGGQFAAGKNKIINGDFGIWQRGTSFSNPKGIYTADRYQYNYDGTGNLTLSRQGFTAGTAPVAGYEGQYFLRVNQTTAGSGGTFNVLQQPIEDVRTFAGQTVTVSFWAKADAARVTNVSLVQTFGTGGSGSVGNGYVDVTLTTSWARYSVVIAVTSITGKTIGTGDAALRLFFDNPKNTTFTIDFWGIQVEAGSTATPFQTATGTIQGELAACQRYYYRQTSVSSYGWMAYGGCQNSTNGQAGLVLPVQMRVVPTALEYANVRIVDSSYAGSLTTLALNTNESTPNLADIYVTGSGITGGRPLYIGANNNTGAYLAVTAEL